jgi:recombination protein RecT
MSSEPIVHPSAKRTKSKRSKAAKAPGMESKKTKPIESIRRALELMKPQLASALPPHLSADRLVRVVVTVLQANPALLDCERASLYRAVMTCAQLGLEPDGVLGQAWLVPSRGKVQLVPGYHGFIALARDSGLITSINAQAVHRNDHFDYAYGLNERLEHVPAAGARGEITHFYGYVKFKDGGHHFDVLSRDEVDAIRDRSEGYQAFRIGKAEDSAWVTGYAEMGKKTVIRRIAKYLPLSVQKAAALADLHDAGKHAGLDDLGEIVVDLPDVEIRPATEPATTRSRLDAFAAGEPMTQMTPRTPRTPITPRTHAASPVGKLTSPSVPPAAPEGIPTLDAEGIELSEEELFALLPPIHILRILDAVAERDLPEEVLAEIVGRPLDEITAADEEEILRAIATWEPEGGGDLAL